MKRTLLVLSIMFLLVNKSYASGGEPLSGLQQLCATDFGTGFNWENGAWKPVNFVKPTYFVTKVSFPDAFPDSSESGVSEEQRIYLDCTWKLETLSEGSYEHTKIYNSCLRVQRFGSDRSTYYPCRELHSRRKEEQLWDVTVHCSDDNFHMKPNGHFHMATIHGELDAQPEGDYKDSLVIYVGKCVSIAN